MKLLMFSVYDKKGACYGTPFFMSREATAVRSFQELVNDEKTTICKYSEDFSLESIGEFNDEDSKVRAWAPKTVVNASALKNDPARDLTQVTPGNNMQKVVS